MIKVKYKMIDELKAEKRNLTSLFLFYLLSQGLILIVSGLWYDDWCIINISTEGLRTWSLEMGRPEFYVIVYIINKMPDFFYKFLIFSFYYITITCFFMIIKKSLPIKTVDAFEIALLYMCMPVNDIRIERLGIPYALGQSLFMVAFMLLVYLYEELKFGHNIFILLLFFVSYILNSLLVYMGLVWLYIIYREKSLKRLVNKAGYFCVPIIYYVMDMVLFPAHGVYANYNRVTPIRMVGAPGRTFMSINSIISNVIKVYSDLLINKPWLIIVFYISVISLTWVHVKKKKVESENVMSIDVFKSIVYEIVIGYVALFAGIYPYVTVGNTIEITGFNSRNVILAPLGLSLLVHALIKVVLKKEFRHFIIAWMMIVSVVFFTKQYADLQSMYYYDRGLQIYLTKHPELSELKNIALYAPDGKGSMYIYNGIFEEVYGNESRLVENMYYCKPFDPSKYLAQKEREWYNMMDCDLNYREIDCLILYTNLIGKKDALITRIRELMGQDVDDTIIRNASFSIVYPDDELFDDYIE